MKVLVTGGAGFIGSNFIRYIIKKHPTYKIINLDKLTYAGNLENLADVEQNKSYRFVKGDICDQKLVDQVVEEGIDAIVNFAAESHVDRSLYDPKTFMQTNVLGTQTLMESGLKHRIKKYIQISTDEVYGSLKEGDDPFTEKSSILSNSPYSASKASADLLVRAYQKTFDLPAVITRCCNNYGPHQFPEKLIPLFITNAMEDKSLPIYGDGLYIRDWIYVEDHCRAIDLILHKGKVGEIYNISSNVEKTNLEITRMILAYLKKPSSLIKHVKDRPAHDRRYALKAEKIRKDLGWEPEVSFEQGISLTIDWYIKNKGWWEKVKSGEYLEYYQKHYIKRENS
ncbi:MAG: dTDP-glucose 4,6-dehydratase [candidate division Zixibacteria bacterium SM23_73_2]|nr:MAG: dTDP-glucose 4,6-dehydratase [candidate division Zixibacteria bacterium SM23_73_2]